MKQRPRFHSDEFYTDACKYYNADIEKFKKDIWLNLRKLGFRFIVLVSYLVVGSLIFFYIEHCYHVVSAPVRRPLEKGFYQLCKKINSSSWNSTQTNVSSMQDQLQTMCDEISRDVPVYTCDLTFENFMRWLEYVITVAFTIGYGYVVCHSPSGKIATILYTLPAIAVTIRFYACAGEILAALTNILIIKFELQCLKRTYIWHLRFKTVSLLVILSVMFWALIVVANIPLMSAADDGTLLDFVYMSFITLTSIGFGDFSYSFHQSIEKPHVFISTFILYILAIGALASVFTELSQVGTKAELVDNEVESSKEINKATLKERNRSKKRYLTTRSRGLRKTIERLQPIGREQNKQHTIDREQKKQYAIGRGDNNDDYVNPLSFLNMSNKNNDYNIQENDVTQQGLEDITSDMDKRCQRVTETELYIGCNRGNGVCY